MHWLLGHDLNFFNWICDISQQIRIFIAFHFIGKPYFNECFSCICNNKNALWKFKTKRKSINSIIIIGGWKKTGEEIHFIFTLLSARLQQFMDFIVAFVRTKPMGKRVIPFVDCKILKIKIVWSSDDEIRTLSLVVLHSISLTVHTCGLIYWVVFMLESFQSFSLTSKQVTRIEPSAKPKIIAFPVAST